MKTILVRVTREDIRKGKASMKTLSLPLCETCPIARPVRRIEGFQKAEVWENRVWIKHSVAGHQFPLPKRAIAFIKRFDSGKPVKPFSFRLKVP